MRFRYVLVVVAMMGLITSMAACSEDTVSIPSTMRSSDIGKSGGTSTAVLPTSSQEAGIAPSAFETGPAQAALKQPTCVRVNISPDLKLEVVCASTNDPKSRWLGYDTDGHYNGPGWVDLDAETGYTVGAPVDGKTISMFGLGKGGKGVKLLASTPVCVIFTHGQLTGGFACNGAPPCEDGCWWGGLTANMPLKRDLKTRMEYMSYCDAATTLQPFIFVNPKTGYVGAFSGVKDDFFEAGMLKSYQYSALPDC